MKDNSTRFCPECRKKDILNELDYFDGFYLCDECDKQFPEKDIDNEE